MISVYRVYPKQDRDTIVLTQYALSGSNTQQVRTWHMDVKRIYFK